MSDGQEVARAHFAALANEMRERGVSTLEQLAKARAAERIAALGAEVAALRQRVEAAEAREDELKRLHNEDARRLGQMATDLMAMRQRAEAAERERDQWRAASMAENQKRRVAEAERAAQSDLKCIAYETLDDVREVVEEMIVPALERIHVNRLVDDGETCSCGECSQCLASAALAAARKTLED